MAKAPVKDAGKETIQAEKVTLPQPLLIESWQKLCGEDVCSDMA